MSHGPRLNRLYNGCYPSFTTQKQTKQDQNRQQEISRWPGRNNRQLISDRLGIERLMTILSRHILTFVSLIQHLYITTERNSAERKLCPMPIHPHGKWTTKANGKSQNTDTATASNPVMPVLMNGDKDSQRHQSHHNRKQHLHWLLRLPTPSTQSHTCRQCRVPHCRDLGPH